MPLTLLSWLRGCAAKVFALPTFPRVPYSFGSEFSEIIESSIRRIIYRYWSRVYCDMYYCFIVQPFFYCNNSSCCFCMSFLEYMLWALYPPLPPTLQYAEHSRRNARAAEITPCHQIAVTLELSLKVGPSRLIWVWENRLPTSNSTRAIKSPACNQHHPGRRAACRAVCSGSESICGASRLSRRLSSGAWLPRGPRLCGENEAEVGLPVASQAQSRRSPTRASDPQQISNGFEASQANTQLDTKQTHQRSPDLRLPHRPTQLCLLHLLFIYLFAVCVENSNRKNWNLCHSFYFLPVWK